MDFSRENRSGWNVQLSGVRAVREVVLFLKLYRLAALKNCLFKRDDLFPARFTGNNVRYHVAIAARFHWLEATQT